MDIKVSVIIPAYNAEKYVTGAVDSALAQTLSDIELIIVDDHSTDSTLSLLEKTYGDNERVRILVQPQNGGVSMARNRGIREAKGEYIAFLDSDDAMRPDMLETMYAAAKEYDADVLHTTGCLLPKVQPVPLDISSLEPDQYQPFIPEMCQKGDDVYFAPSDIRERMDKWYAHNYHWSVWNKLFRRRFIETHKILFDDLSMAEDMLFCFKALFLSERYVVLPGQWYVYRIGGDSLSRQNSTIETVTKLTERQIRAAAAIKRFTDTCDFFKENPADRIRLHRMVCDSIDRFYLVPALEALTQEAVQDSDAVTALLDKEFGENSAFVGYLYWRLHDLMRDGFDLSGLSENAEKIAEKTEKEKKKKQDRKDAND